MKSGPRFTDEQRQSLTEELVADWLINEQSLRKFAQKHDLNESTAARLLHSVGVYPCTCVCPVRRRPTEADVRLALGTLPLEKGVDCAIAQRPLVARKLLHVRRKLNVPHRQLAKITGKSEGWVMQMLRFAKVIEALDDLRSGRFIEMAGLLGRQDLQTALDGAGAVIDRWFERNAPDYKPNDHLHKGEDGTDRECG